MKERIFSISLMLLMAVSGLTLAYQPEPQPISEDGSHLLAEGQIQLHAVAVVAPASVTVTVHPLETVAIGLFVLDEPRATVQLVPLTYPATAPFLSGYRDLHYDPGLCGYVHV